MTFTLTYAWWWIPTFVSILALIYGMWPDRPLGFVDDMFKPFFALFIVAVSWAIAGFFK